MTSDLVSHVRFVVPRYPEVSGGATVVTNLARALMERGISVDVMSVYPGDAPSRGLSSVAVHTVLTREQLHRHPVSDGRPWWQAAPLALAKRADRRRRLAMARRSMEVLPADSAVIFTHVMGKQILDESGYERPAGGPLLFGQHHSSFASLDDEPWLRDALPRHFASCDAFVALSPSDADDFARLLPVPCVSIANPASPARGDSDPEAHRAVALVRLSHEKQIPLMVRLFAEATRLPETSTWSLSIFGDGVERPEVAAQIDTLGVRDRVELAGVAHEAAEALDGASLNLLTSSLEGFGMSILEAATFGVPSVAFDCSDGVRRQLDGEAGYLVPPQDEAAYVEALRTAMTDDTERRRRGENARARAERYSPSRVVDEWLALIERSRVAGARPILSPAASL